MTTALTQHQVEIERNLRAWQNKPLLREIYAGFYRRILTLIDPTIEGRIVEIGSGIGNLKAHLPEAISTDLFPNPWIDVVCDGYELPFPNGTLSHLILFDVFHHLKAPNAFLAEARRVLTRNGRLILFEPFVSCASYLIYGLFHHEPVAMAQDIDFSSRLDRPRHYYAAQGNATRLFFRHQQAGWLNGWHAFHRQAFASFSYLLSGGFSKSPFYPTGWVAGLQRWDEVLSQAPRLFGARCIIGLKPAG
jgi:SAM-dependent methyltransferase